MNESHGRESSDQDSGNQAPPADAISRALQFFRTGDFPAALQCAEEIIAAQGDVGLSWRFKGECLFSMGRFDEAVASFQTAANTGGDGTDDMFLWISLCHANAGRIDEAKQVLNDYLRHSKIATPELIGRAQDALNTLNSMSR